MLLVPPPELIRMLRDPLKFGRFFWPHYTFYDKQIEVIRSVEENDETVVPAGNMLGKDFVAGFICLWYFLTRDPVRIVTTSIADDHLRVLWDEIARFIQTAAHKDILPMYSRDGGPLRLNHRDIRKVWTSGELCGELMPISYLIGQVSKKGEKMAGHHAAHTLAVVDEACHDDKTEVLTDSGWRHFADLSGNEKLLSMDPLTRIAQYQQPTEIYRNEYSGPMYLYERRCGNFCVTPAHRMLWSRQRASCAVPWSDYYLQPIHELNGTDRCIPRCFRWQGRSPKYFDIPGFKSERKSFESCRVPMPEWLEFLGWYLAEGSLGFHRNGDPNSVNVSQKNVVVLHRLEGLLKSWGFSPHVYTGPSACVRVGERRFAEYMITHGRYSYEKFVPSYVFSLSPHLIEIFLKAFKDGDGYDRENGREIYYTSSRKLADAIQILSYKTGRESTICERSLVGLPAPNGFSRRDGFIVSRSKPGLDSHLKLKRIHLKRIDYSGMVYCANVPPHHTLFTRRNGVCMWSGNSGVEDLVYNQMCTWADGRTKKRLVFGNCNPCNNFFLRAVKGGDMLAISNTNGTKA